MKKYFRIPPKRSTFSEPPGFSKFSEISFLYEDGLELIDKLTRAIYDFQKKHSPSVKIEALILAPTEAFCFTAYQMLSVEGGRADALIMREQLETGEMRLMDIELKVGDISISDSPVIIVNNSDKGVLIA